MVNIKTDTVSLEDWVNMLSDKFDFSLVYSIFMPTYLSVFKKTKSEIKSFTRTTYEILEAENDEKGTPEIDETWEVYDSPNLKFVTGDCQNYNMLFNKLTGHMLRFGKSLETKDDPAWCKLGPELLDIEISINGCPKVGGANCRFCYKNNSDFPATNMSFEQFKNIIDKFPKTLCQVPFGITGVKTNPHFVDMMKYVREEFGAVPTLTLSGKDLDSDMTKNIVKYCGACAVSCYESDKELCYRTIDDIHAIDPHFHVNMHVVLGNATIDHCMSVLNDIKNGVVKDVGSVVFLTLKPKGRASVLDCSLSKENVAKVVLFCKENHIRFGFDSCNAKNIETILNETGFKNPEHFCESCESSKFSSYVNVRGEYHHCSFAEGIVKKFPNIGEFQNAEAFIDWWRNDEYMLELRNPKERKSDSCQFYSLDLS